MNCEDSYCFLLSDLAASLDPAPPVTVVEPVVAPMESSNNQEVASDDVPSPPTKRVAVETRSLTSPVGRVSRH
jgi:hypothetical protein